MKTIAIGLQKGGTGKTTLAAELAGYGQTTLIDADPQGNASAWVGPDSLSAELAGVLFEHYPLEQAITSTETTGIALLPSAGLGGELKMFIETTATSEPFCMQGLLEKIAAHGYCMGSVKIDYSYDSKNIITFYLDENSKDYNTYLIAFGNGSTESLKQKITLIPVTLNAIEG
jgi:chromosome partitioning protein